MKILKYILLAIVLLGSEQIALSQYYLKAKSDSISLQSDSVLIFLNEYRGVINWQASSDLINWVPLNEIKDTLGIRIDSSAYYRATIIEGTCNPVMSDTVFLIEKLTVTNSNQLTVDSLGGVFLLSSGIKIKVPRGAVKESTTVEVFTLDSLSVRNEMPFVRDSGKYFINALRFKPESFRFQKPIKIIVPALKYKYSSLPMVHSLNTVSEEWKEYNGYLLCSQKDNFIELVTDSLSPVLIDAYPNIFGSRDKSKQEFDCKLFLVKIVTSSNDNNQIHKKIECFGIQDKGSVEFTFCPGSPIEEWEITEISRDCVPEVSLYINGDLDISMLKVGEEAELAFFTHVTGIPLKDQSVNVVLPSGIREGALSGNTGDDGGKTFQINPVSENLNGEIAYFADFKYCLQLIEATANGVSEPACQIEPLKEVITPPKSKQIIIYDDCTDPAKIDCNQNSDPNCQTIKELLIDHIELDPITKTIEKGDNNQINVKAFNLNGTDLNKTFETKWSSSNEASVSVVNGLITGVEKGKATITAEVCNKKADCLVEVINTICDSAKVTVSPQSVNITEGCYYRIDIEYGASANGETYIPVIKFSSINTGVATVDDNGIIHGISKGQTTIVVSWCKESFTINVAVEEVDYCDYGTFIDGRDGQEYKWIKIGQQIWMAENLNYSGITSFCYNNDQGLCDIYGRLYYFYVINNACPVGWHLPSDNEWIELEVFLGMPPDEAYNDFITGLGEIRGEDENVGGKLKEIGTEHWLPYNNNATNEVCFTALPSGRFDEGYSHGLGGMAEWWTSSIYEIEIDEGLYDLYSIVRGIYLDDDEVDRYLGYNKNNFPKKARSIRCVKDN